MLIFSNNSLKNSTKTAQKFLPKMSLPGAAAPSMWDCGRFFALFGRWFVAVGVALVMWPPL